jgi:lysozyme
VENVVNIANNFIKAEEGLKLTAYQDQGGRYTVGWGSTGPGIEAGTQWSPEQANERLREDIISLEARIKKVVRVSLTDNMLAALISFCYNLGVFNLQRSGLLKRLNVGDYAGAADQFQLWNKIGLYVSPGLSARRAREKALFLSKSPSPSDTPPQVA